MSRIVLTTIGSFGDLHPKLAIALELRQRGHSVVVATHREYRAKIERLGLEFVRMRPDNTALTDPAEMARMMDLKTGTEYVIKNWVCPSLRESYADLLGCCQGADLILAGEGALAARLVAEKLAIPWVSVALQPLTFMSIYDPFVLPILPWLAKFRWLGGIATRGIRVLSKQMSKAWAEPIVQLRRELDLSPLQGSPFIDDKFSPDLVLAMFSRAFAQPQPDWPPNTVITGFPFYDGSEEMSAPPELIQFLDAGAPPIVFTLGSAAVMAPGQFYEESIAAAKLLNRRAVLLIGKNPQPANLTDDIIAIEYAPYSQIFHYASAIVHQGGIGTTAQALRSGRPTVIMPYSHDQPDNAARVKRLGTSRTIPRQKYTVDRVVKELQIILEQPKYATKAAEIGQILRSEHGVKVACDAIEKQLQQQPQSK